MADDLVRLEIRLRQHNIYSRRYRLHEQRQSLSYYTKRRAFASRHPRQPTQPMRRRLLRPIVASPYAVRQRKKATTTVDVEFFWNIFVFLQYTLATIFIIIFGS